MTCGSCVDRVQRALAAVDGVTSVRVELATGAAQVPTAPRCSTEARPPKVAPAPGSRPQRTLLPPQVAGMEGCSAARLLDAVRATGKGAELHGA